RPWGRDPAARRSRHRCPARPHAQTQRPPRPRRPEWRRPGWRRPGSRTLRSWRQCWSSGHPLDDEGHTLSAADAQGGQAELAIALAKAIDQGGGHAGTGGAPGVAERDRPAMDVERVVVDAE